MDRVSCIDYTVKSLLRIGYRQNHIEYNFAFVSEEGPFSVDTVAFSNEYKKDYLTSCIAIKYCDSAAEIENYRKKLAYTAAPIAFLLTPNYVLIQPLYVTKRIEPIRKNYLEFENYVVRHRLSLLPEILYSVKKEGRQLSLFELDPTLYEYVSEISKKHLVTRFEGSIRSAAEFLKGIGKETDALNTLTKIAIKLLAAKILEDKKLFGTQPMLTDASSLLKKAGMSFPGYFDVGEINKIGGKTANVILEYLGKDYNYGSISNEQLGYFYEHTFVTKGLRKELGIYYTPQKIATQMLKSLPIEELPPEDRYFLDGTCGSGGLLAAAYSRLNDLSSKAEAADRRHKYLVSHIRGFDIDPFAVEIAKKALLLASLPFGDSWQVTREDFLKIKNLSFLPYIIVANPPFKEKRETSLSQKATLFLEKYLSLLPVGGLISIVLPESYLQNRSCRKSRKKLLGDLDILEVWQLPEGAFPMAQFSTVVISGRKFRPKNLQPVRIRRLMQKEDAYQFPNDKIHFDFSFTTDDHTRWLNDKENEIVVSPFQDIWKKLDSFPKVHRFFHVKNGILVGKSGKEDLHTNETEGAYKFLGGTSFISPHFVFWERQGIKGLPSYVTYPGNLHRPRRSLKDVFQSKNRKILINANRSTSNPWRLYAAVDRTGYFPFHGFHAIYAKRSDTPRLEVLSALLNSYVANAFVDSFARRRWITEDNIKEIPIPHFTSDETKKITRMVIRIEEIEYKSPTLPNYHLTDDSDIKEIQQLVEELDSIIMQAYHLTLNQQERIMALFNGFHRPGLPKPAIVTSQKVRETKESWKITGRIMHIDVEKQMLSIWLMGYNRMDSPFEIPIPDSLPGWGLKVNVSFEARIPFMQRHEKEIGRLTFLDFGLLRNAYMSDEEVEQAMSNTSVNYDASK
ncbi:MAG: N-6 DNA methylase [Nitrospirae bacterium]|nr:N-6 DNA methylase [Nitrospirota bacterium]